MIKLRKCSNCKNRRWESWSGIDYCPFYEMATETEEIEKATECSIYEEETEEEREYCPSATAGDYSPSNPWDAPGMSIKDFI